MERAKQTQSASRVIGEHIDLPGKPEFPRRPSSYDQLKKLDPEHKVIKAYEEKLKAYQEYWAEVDRLNPPSLPPESVKLKKLVEMDIKSLYGLFCNSFFEVTGHMFNPEANDGEAKKLVYTLLYYLCRSENFLKSPLLNREVSEPDIKKSLLVIGGYGCGKTSVFKSLHKLFFEAERSKEIMVKDVEGDFVHLHRYRRGFAYHTANGAVEQFEACDSPERKERFWKITSGGLAYFDDVMTERQASNYGKVELFKDIFEKRYEASKFTMASCNYPEIMSDNGVRLGSVKETVIAIGNRYGPRVHDRMWSFNIIELKGKSMRK
jgi:hypothetical protein